MLIIRDKTTGKIINNMGTNKRYPDGDIPNLSKLPDNYEYVRLHDGSDQAKLINTAYDYNLSVDKNGNCTAVTVNKTMQQHISEQPAIKTSKEIAKENLTKAGTINEKLQIVLEYLNLN